MIGTRIGDALVGFPKEQQVSVVFQVFSATAYFASYVDPTVKERSWQQSAGSPGNLPRGVIGLPQSVLSQWSGTDPAIGTRTAPLTSTQVASLLFGSNTDEKLKKYLNDALSRQEALKFALNADPGMTLALGFLGFYVLPTGGGPVANETRYGELKGFNVSRMFAVHVRTGAGAPEKPLDQIPRPKLRPFR